MHLGVLLFKKIVLAKLEASSHVHFSSKML